MLRLRRTALYSIMLVIVALGVSGCGCSDRSDSRNRSDVDSTPKYICPFDGTPLEVLPTGAPLAVIIDNHPLARPQSGLSQADLVFETLAEGGVTRYLAVYYHGEASNVGPVRSARSYFIDLAMSVNAVLIHAGGSPDALEYMRSHRFPHLNEFNYGDSFRRVSTRTAPHNLYTSTEDLHDTALEAGWEHPAQVPGITFRQDTDAGSEVLPLKSETASESQTLKDVLVSREIEIGFPRQYNVSYTYLPESKGYSRFIAGEPHLDELTGSQLQPRNIIVKFVKTRVIDSQGRLKIDVAGHGRALVFSEGKVIDAVWKKDDPHQISTYETAEGKVIELLPGQVWVEIVPENTEVTF